MEAELLANNRTRLESGDSLSEIEKELFQKIRSVISAFPTKITVRVAGGWVRDKLLGKANDDIDLAVEGTDCMSFTESLKPFYPQSSPIALIPAKPDQRKFLDIARIRLFKDFDLDICGLRPDLTAASDLSPAAIDAFRRDFTVNALFFNVNEFLVEDFVNGIHDLEIGIIKTPISVAANFGDDPLRILRAFRFAARFHFSLESEILSPPQNILNSFATDIKRDRFELELSKILIGDSVPQVLQWFVQAGVWKTVFDYRDQFKLDPNIPRVQTALDRFHQFYHSDFLQGLTPDEIIPSKLRESELISSLVSKTEVNRLQKEIILSAIFYPLSTTEVTQDPALPKKKISIIQCAISRNLEMSLEIGASVSRLIAAAKELEEMKGSQLQRVSVGLWMRAIGPEWVLSRTLLSNDGIIFFDRFLVAFIFSNNLEGVWKMAPLLNGRDLASIHGIKPGPQLGKLVKELVEWQLANPTGTVDDYKSCITAKQ